MSFFLFPGRYQRIRYFLAFIWSSILLLISVCLTLSLPHLIINNILFLFFIFQLFFFFFFFFFFYSFFFFVFYWCLFFLVIFSLLINLFKFYKIRNRFKCWLRCCRNLPFLQASEARLTGASSKGGKCTESPPTFIERKTLEKPKEIGHEEYSRFGSCIYV